MLPLEEMAVMVHLLIYQALVLLMQVEEVVELEQHHLQQEVVALEGEELVTMPVQEQQDLFALLEAGFHMLQQGSGQGAVHGLAAHIQRFDHRPLRLAGPFWQGERDITTALDVAE